MVRAYLVQGSSALDASRFVRQKKLRVGVSQNGLAMSFISRRTKPTIRTARNPEAERRMTRGRLLPGDEPRLGLPAALNAFYEEQGRALRACLGKVTYYGLDPDDIVQDTLELAHRCFAETTLPPHDELLGWCCVAGERLALRKAKRAQREQPWAEPFTTVEHLLPIDAQELAADAVDVQRVMAKLSPEHQEILGLDSDGYTTEKIAERLGLTHDAARKRLQRAREAARKAFGPGFAAAFLGLPLRFRRLGTTAPAWSQAQTAAVASVTMVSLVVALVLPGFATLPIQRRAKQSAPSVVAYVAAKVAVVKSIPQDGGPSAPMSTIPPAGPGISSNGVGATGRLHVRTTVCAPHVCIASSCPKDSPASGDRVYLKAAPCDVNTTESTTPICGYVLANPVVGCEQQGKPQWQVPPPSNITGGPPWTIAAPSRQSQASYSAPRVSS